MRRLRLLQLWLSLPKQVLRGEFFLAKQTIALIIDAVQQLEEHHDKTN